MTDAFAELPNNVDELKAIIRDYEKKLLWAEEKYRAMELRYFGQKSEHYQSGDDKQNRLFDEAEEYAIKSPPALVQTLQIPAHERAKRGRKPKTTATERIEIVHDLTDDEKRCPCCGEARKSIGEERTSEYDLVPAHVVERVHIIKKYGPCSCEAFAGSGAWQWSPRLGRQRSSLAPTSRTGRRPSS